MRNRHTTAIGHRLAKFEGERPRWAAGRPKGGPIGLHLEPFATAFRVDVQDCSLVSVSGGSRSVELVKTERPAHLSIAHWSISLAVRS